MRRKLVFCADGTWNTATQRDRGVEAPSNVANIARAIVFDDEQIVLYDEGVGTGSWYDRVIGGAVGVGLGRNVREGYRFLCKNWRAGDEIFLFGFSRGAYTVRSLGGLIYKCGLLANPSREAVLDAYAFYRTAVKPGDPEAGERRDRLAVPDSRRVDFIGVWETVGALGVPWPRLRKALGIAHFHDVTLNRKVRFGYHAVAVDEEREAFEPTLWDPSDPREDDPPQTVEQAWFSGVHSNVGGGYRDTGLSDLTLGWMMDRAAGAGLRFHADGRFPALAPDPAGAIRDPRRGWKRLIYAARETRELLAWRRDEERPASERDAPLVHDSVFERLRCATLRPPYRPPGLDWDDWTALDRLRRCRTGDALPQRTDPSPA